MNCKGWNRVARTSLVITVGWLIAGCMAAPVEDTQSTSQEISGSDDGPPDPPDPPVCNTTPGCRSEFLGGYTTALQSQLHCFQSYHYLSGANSGFIGGIYSNCPDSPTNRLALRFAGYRAYLPGYCSTCLKVPVGRLYVFWEEDWGPGCPSSCTSAPAPSQL